MSSLGRIAADDHPESDAALLAHGHVDAIGEVHAVDARAAFDHRVDRSDPLELVLELVERERIEDLAEQEGGLRDHLVGEGLDDGRLGAVLERDHEDPGGAQSQGGGQWRAHAEPAVHIVAITDPDRGKQERNRRGCAHVTRGELGLDRERVRIVPPGRGVGERSLHEHRDAPDCPPRCTRCRARCSRGRSQVFVQRVPRHGTLDQRLERSEVDEAADRAGDRAPPLLVSEQAQRKAEQIASAQPEHVVDLHREPGGDQQPRALRARLVRGRGGERGVDRTHRGARRDVERIL